ncbi:MAG: hypothetical protein DMG36_18685 [Acidobacteria bacterium]|nr:MAG: hypothetical protein DMG36_18685 [Acidobacteriota bacterium]
MFRSPLDGAGSVLTVRTRCSVAGRVAQRLGFSLPAVFIASWHFGMVQGGSGAGFAEQGGSGETLFAVFR